MSRFVARMNDDSFINVEADVMRLDDERNCLLVIKGTDLVAVVDLAVVLTAHMSEEKKE